MAVVSGAASVAAGAWVSAGSEVSSSPPQAAAKRRKAVTITNPGLNLYHFPPGISYLL